MKGKKAQNDGPIELKVCCVLCPHLNNLGKRKCKDGLFLDHPFFLHLHMMSCITAQDQFGRVLGNIVTFSEDSLPSKAVRKIEIQGMEGTHIIKVLCLKALINFSFGPLSGPFNWPKTNDLPTKGARTESEEARQGGKRPCKVRED